MLPITRSDTHTGKPQGMESVVTALAESLDKPFPWGVRFRFGNTELNMGLWTTIAEISGFDD